MGSSIGHNPTFSCQQLVMKYCLGRLKLWMEKHLVNDINRHNTSICDLISTMCFHEVPHYFMAERPNLSYYSNCDTSIIGRFLVSQMCHIKQVGLKCSPEGCAKNSNPY